MQDSCCFVPLPIVGKLGQSLRKVSPVGSFFTMRNEESVWGRMEQTNNGGVAQQGDFFMQTGYLKTRARLTSTLGQEVHLRFTLTHVVTVGLPPLTGIKITVLQLTSFKKNWRKESEGKREVDGLF